MKLAGELVQRYGAEELKKSDLKEKRFIFFERQLSDTVLQGILYRRILAHIHNPDIKQIANPGLVLRIITPALIFKVLNVPCELHLQKLEQAEILFEELSKEISLIVRTETRTLRHRADVRKVMLKLICEENPQLVMEIHERAVAYYQELGDISSLAEGFYHRLCLDESPRILDKFWLPGFENYLLSNMDDFSNKGKTFLAGRTGIELADLSIWKEADSVDVDRRWLRLAANLLNHGNAEEFLSRLEKEEIIDLKSGVINMLKVRALVQLSRVEEAFTIARQTLKSFYADQFSPQITIELQKVIDRHNRIVDQPIIETTTEEREKSNEFKDPDDSEEMTFDLT